MRRRLFPLVAAISLLACGPFLYGAILMATVGDTGSMRWSTQAQQWVFDPPVHTRRNTILFFILTPVFAAAPLIWLRRFLRVQRARNREWRGQCHTCGYDLRGTTGTCPECGTIMPASYRGEQRQPGHRIGPGTQATILLFVFVPIAAVLVYGVVLFVLILLFPPVF